jgi:diguanylate cyclase (GGDEF)-like protein
MIDIDNFKNFNDLFGHPAGDEYLIHISSLLKKAVRRSSDIIARYGGEEFVIALPHLGRDEAYRFAERIRSEVEKHLLKWNERGTEHIITISVGLCTVIPSHAFTVEDLVYSSDKALYKAKEQRNRTMVMDIVKADERPSLTLIDDWEAMGI